MRLPVVSVVLPVRDARDTLAVCLGSVARQRLTDWECLVVDDGSTDGSLELARELARGDPRFRVLVSPDRGLVPALNHGLEHAGGRLTARIDADDWMHRDRLAAQTALLDGRPEWAGVGCHARGFPRSSMGPGDRAYESWINRILSPADIRRELFVECPLLHPTWLFRTPTLRNLRYVERGWPEDYDLLLRLVTAGGQLGVLPERRLSWRHGGDRLSRRSSIYSAESFTRCKAHYLTQSFLASSDRYLLWGYGASGRRLRHALAGHGRLPSHVVEIHPGRIGNRIHGAPVVGIDAVASLPRRPLIVSVAGAGPRAEIRRLLTGLGWTETRDFYCAA
jgi:glycosyltransferase involved in cell wall biosynthesis